MAALDFPSNPTNGQVYGNYAYDSTLGAWRATAVNAAATFVSATAPVSTTAGDLWWNSNDGSFYVNYYDGGGYQWVEGRAPVTAGGQTSPNYIINGAFDIWQRGTSFSSVAGGTYTADRWATQPGMGAQTVTRVTDTPTGYGYALRLQRSAVVGCGLVQRVEAANAVRLIGKTLTVSYWAKTASTGQTVRAQLLYPSATDNFATTTLSQSLSASVTSTWTKYSFTFTALSSLFSTGLELRIGSNSAAVDTHDVYIGDVQLEEGSVATPFRRNANSIQGELAACQRYYYRKVSPNTTATLATGIAYSTTGAMLYVQLPVSMRIPPSASDSSAASTLSVGNHVSGTTISSTGIDARYTTNEVACLNTSASGMTATTPWMLQANATGAYVGFNAEL